jgi:hypothetical protein
MDTNPDSPPRPTATAHHLLLGLAVGVCLLILPSAGTAQCNPPVVIGLSFSPSAVTAMTNFKATTGTVTISCTIPQGSSNSCATVSSSPSGGPGAYACVLPGHNSTTFTWSAENQVSQTTAYTVTASGYYNLGGSAQTSFTVNPYSVSATIVPGSIVAGSSNQAVETLTVDNGAVTSI